MHYASRTAAKSAAAAVPTAKVIWLPVIPNSTDISAHQLDLALTAKAVALHGGHVGAENAAGGGLRVTITLPVPEDGQR